MDTQALIELRHAQGFTQAQVALAAGMSRLTYINKEKSPEKFSIGEWSRMATFFGLDPTTLKIPVVKACEHCSGKGYVYA